MPTDRVAVRGSERRDPSGASAIAVADSNEEVNATVVIRRKTEEVTPFGGTSITREQFADLYGASPADVEQIEQFAVAHGLTVGEADLARRTIKLHGTVANMNEAFGTELLIFETARGRFRGRTGELYIPGNLLDIVVGVFGLDQRPQARPCIRRRSDGVEPRALGDTSYTPDAVARLYGFPTAGSGSGQAVAIIELGGGFKTSDLTAYFSNLHITWIRREDGVSELSGLQACGPGEYSLCEILYHR